MMAERWEITPTPTFGVPGMIAACGSSVCYLASGMAWKLNTCQQGRAGVFPAPLRVHGTAVTTS